MRVLDLFCGAGGAGAGYARLGWDVTGVDINPQPRYPFRFEQGDALEILSGWAASFDLVHASPPCQRYSRATHARGKAAAEAHPDLVGPVRDLLRAMRVPYVIENVEGAPLIDPVTLCGSMFGLETKRHRLFETSRPVGAPPPHNHVWRDGRPVGVYGHTGMMTSGTRSGNHGWLLADWKRAMDIDWMSRDELAQAIPPAYTEWIGKEMVR